LGSKRSPWWILTFLRLLAFSARGSSRIERDTHNNAAVLASSRGRGPSSKREPWQRYGRTGRLSTPCGRGKLSARGSGDGAGGGVLGAKKRLGHRFTKNGIRAIPFPLKEFDCCAPRGQRKARQIDLGASPTTWDASVDREGFFYFFSRNPLKRPDSTKEKQGNASFFACFYLHLLAASSRPG
jgi:hypothetical protein